VIARDLQGALEIVQLVKKFGARTALQGLDLSIAAGESVAILGPNGAGKTTLIRCLSGRSRLDGGSIRLFGKSLRSHSSTQKLGVVPQELAIYGDLTLLQNLQTFGRLHGLQGSQLRHRLEWALEWIGLSDRRHHLVGSFSGGMKRRVNIACGVMHRPELLVLDEPTVGVDPQSRQRIFQMLQDLHADGTALLLTTHHLEEAQQQCARIVILDDGKIIADGSLQQLIDQTIGSQCQVDVTIEGELRNAPRHWIWNTQTRRWTANIQDISGDLPRLLGEIRMLGGRVGELRTHAPSLQDVFLHLTGRMLRE
jgi:ABC-2 type transport system ATP-binding protein